MCRPVTCKTCGKTTWAGCGQHMDQVKATVAAGQWCDGHVGQSHAGQKGTGSAFKRLLGR